MTVDPETSKPFLENQQLLDPSPSGTGEWVYLALPKWELNWVKIIP
jgi:hypothetical protein